MDFEDIKEDFYEILLPLPFDHGFSYKSDDLELEEGDVVAVKFRNKDLYGLVVKKFEKSEFLSKNKLDLKKIKQIESKNQFLRLENNIIEFIDRISSYNMVPKGLVLKAFIGFLNSDKVKDDLIEKSCLVQKFDEKKLKLKELSNDQEKISQEISKIFATQKDDVVLIDGVTGSGKTEVYFKVLSEILRDNNSQILIMLPEIALTSQLLSRFEEIFGFEPALWHSKINKKKKREIFYGISRGSVKVVIGARSSLLLPFKNLKLVVIDEEHDGSYKQDEMFNFNARDMAIMKSKIDKFGVILSSATPALESFYNAQSGKYHYFSLGEKFNKKTNRVEIIDLKREKPEKNQFVSNHLRKELAENLAKKHQSLLFLNRRGYSPVMLCKKCGEKVDCRDCTANLVHHKLARNSICHYCGYEEKFSSDCKKCGAEDSIINVGVGVEKLEEEVRGFLPQARIALVTSDNLTNFKDVNKLVKEISNNEIDIIIGTQMIAKGYDFENLTLVGVVDADSGFYSSDLKASEKSYQLLSQVLGRAGRKKHQGKVFIQTYNPEHFILKKLMDSDKSGFYDFELNNREILDLPPFSKMANIIIDSLRQEKALRIAKDIVKNTPFNDNIEVMGPSKSKVFKIKNRYFYSVFFKVSRKINLQKLIFDITNRLDIKNEANIKVIIDP